MLAILATELRFCCDGHHKYDHLAGREGKHRSVPCHPVLRSEYATAWLCCDFRRSFQPPPQRIRLSLRASRRPPAGPLRRFLRRLCARGFCLRFPGYRFCGGTLFCGIASGLVCPLASSLARHNVKGLASVADFFLSSCHGRTPERSDAAPTAHTEGPVSKYRAQIQASDPYS
jgi:hypothetical protein